MRNAGRGLSVNTACFFAGGNTSAGFCSYFEDLLPEEARKRMYYLKGGPGVGKSTFMRRIGEAAEKAGLRVEYFYCSSDPDSLDGVALPQLGAAVMDGTAPHVYDPALPGARDTLISLGDFLDTDRLRPLLFELRGLQEGISARFRQCWHYLAAAGEIDRGGAEAKENPRKAAALAEEWTKALPIRGGTGRARRLFGQAFTPKGLIRKTQAGPNAKLVTCPPGSRPTLTLGLLSQAAVVRGLEFVELADPLLPGETLGLILPEHDLYFGAAPSPGAPGALPWETLFTPVPGEEQERKYSRNLRELLCQRAIEQLSAAKALHDQLEKPYAAAMDFRKWGEVLDRVMDELGLVSEQQDE